MKRIAIVLAEDFEDEEYTTPAQRLTDQGYELTVIGSAAGRELTGKQGQAVVTVDAQASDAYPDDFAALLIPGGYSPDHLRTDAAVVAFVRGYYATGKPVAAICHAPSLLIEAEIVRSKTLTSWPSIKTDLRNAGAMWVDESVVTDENLITSRKPQDLPEFCTALLAQLE